MGWPENREFFLAWMEAHREVYGWYVFNGVAKNRPFKLDGEGVATWEYHLQRGLAEGKFRPVQNVHQLRSISEIEKLGCVLKPRTHPAAAMLDRSSPFYDGSPNLPPLMFSEAERELCESLFRTSTRKE
jgi:hypothetical protein